MTRLFVCHDERGTIVSVAAVRAMGDGLRHPFLITDPRVGVIEVPKGDAAFNLEPEQLQRTHTVDPRTGKLAPLSSHRGASGPHK